MQLCLGNYSCRALGLQDGPCSGPAAPLLFQRKFDAVPCRTWQHLEVQECFANLPAWSGSFQLEQWHRAGVELLHLRFKGALLPLETAGSCVVFPTDLRNCVLCVPWPRTSQELCPSLMFSGPIDPRNCVLPGCPLAPQISGMVSFIFPGPTHPRNCVLPSFSLAPEIPEIVSFPHVPWPYRSQELCPAFLSPGTTDPRNCALSGCPLALHIPGIVSFPLDLSSAVTLMDALQG